MLTRAPNPPSRRPRGRLGRAARTAAAKGHAALLRRLILRLSVICPACLGVVAGAGCRQGAPALSENLFAPGRTLSASVEWDDIDAAVSHAADEHEMAVLSVSDEPSGRRVYTLLTMADTPIRITFTPAAGGDETQEVEIEAQVGLFGDAPQEASILQTLQDRLAWLRERD